MNCQRDNCDRAARWHPVLRFFAPWPSKASFTMEMGLNICARCSGKLKLNDVASPAAFTTAAEVCRRMGKKEPDHERTRLEWIPIAESDLQARPL
jgi:hypothetical protein